MTYEDDNTVIKYLSNVRIYCLAQPSVSFHTFYITYTNIPDLKMIIDETYEHVNHMKLVHSHHLYINEIHMF